MPIYAYRCQQCGEKFETLRGMSQSDDSLVCPKCGAVRPQLLLSSFSSPNSGSSGDGGGYVRPT